MSAKPDSRSILVLQHIGCEPTAAYGRELLARGFSAHEVRLDEHEALPEWSDYAGVIVMGGPMGAYDDALHPWLGPEKRLIAGAVHAGRPFWGVCLGAQLLAAALGAEVSPGPLPEVGVLPVRLTPEASVDPVFSIAPPAFQAFHWHGDTYTLPQGAVRLAGSRQYEQQAFAYRNAYALQFHIEATAVLIEDWGRVPAYADSLARVTGVGGIAELAEQLAAVESASIALARRLFGRWLDLLA